jgi:ubiquinone/menaquinone biosynthesis C-methylase UbiE
MISFQIRTDEDELMDDFSITDIRLTSALEQLRVVNRFLGGYETTMAVLKPYLKQCAQSSARPIRILDLGTGIADFPEYIIRWAATQSIDLEIVAIDANPVTVDYARQALRIRLPEELQSKIHVEVADALNLPYADDSFDVAMGAMFLHHFAEENAIVIVRSMQRVASGGILINDLHRHPLAYYGIYSLTRILQASEMVQNDGPISVLRGFQSLELQTIAQKAGLQDFTIRWRWPFRWLLSTL